MLTPLEAVETKLVENRKLSQSRKVQDKCFDQAAQAVNSHTGLSDFRSSVLSSLPATSHFEFGLTLEKSPERTVSGGINNSQVRLSSEQGSPSVPTANLTERSLGASPFTTQLMKPSQPSPKLGPALSSFDLWGNWASVRSSGSDRQVSLPHTNYSTD